MVGAFVEAQKKTERETSSLILKNIYMFVCCWLNKGKSDCYEWYSWGSYINANEINTFRNFNTGKFHCSIKKYVFCWNIIQPSIYYTIPLEETYTCKVLYSVKSTVSASFQLQFSTTFFVKFVCLKKKRKPLIDTSCSVYLTFDLGINFASKKVVL